MATATAKKNELKSAVREALIEVLKEDREVFQDLLVEVFEDMVLLRAMEEGRKTKLVPREKVLEVLRRGKK